MYHITVGDGPVRPASVGDGPVPPASDLSFWATPALLQHFANRDKISFSYLYVYKGDTLKAIMPVFMKRKYGLRYTYQPILYKYSPVDFFQEPSQNIFHIQNEQLEILTCLAKYLRRNYKRCSIAFECAITDMRGFLGAGFSVEPHYTFTKLISSYNPAEHPRILRRSLKEGADFGIDVKECWDINMLQGLCLGFTQRKSEWNMRFDSKLFTFLQALHNDGLCTAVAAFKDGMPLAFRVLFLDKIRGNLYDMLAGANEIGDKHGANAHCLDYIFTHFTQYKLFDFCGANIPKIAFFKSQFNCELVHYFAVKGWWVIGN